MEKQSTVKKVLVGLLIALIGAGIGFGVASATVEPKIVEKPVNQTVPVFVDVPGPVVEKIVNQTIEVPVEKIVYQNVSVDNGKLSVVLQHIYDNSGDVSYLVGDLKDTEVSQIADRVVFVNDIKTLAAQAAKKDLADLVDKETVSGVVIDDKDVERVRVKDDFDEIVVDDIDFDESDATLLVSATFEQDDIDYKAVVEVTIRDGEVDDTSLDSLDLK